MDNCKGKEHIMKSKMCILSCILIFLSLFLQGQSNKVHSHNDYEQQVPFWGAFAAGVSSIEVDVFVEGDNLFVAHELKQAKSYRTLKRLYLNPINESLKLGLVKKSLQLLIDVKSEPYSTLNAIINVLKEYPLITNSKNIKIVISGNKPQPKEYINYPDFILFDHPSLTPIDNDCLLEKIGMVSLPYHKFSRWNGKGRHTVKDYITVINVITKAHELGKPFRFWGTPDSKSAWKAFVDMGVDFINTDMPNECVAYVETLSSRMYQNTNFSEVYRPTFESDKMDRKPKNIILFIGDGYGLTQISSAIFANGGELSLTQLTSIGFIKTQSADDFTTDSAGAGTAIATGKKTKNRAIGTDINETVISNITELLSKEGFSTGVISTNQITDATPSAFYAHQTDRDMENEIAEDLNKSQLNLFISQQSPKIKNSEDGGFKMMNQLNEIGNSHEHKVGAFFSYGVQDEKMADIEKLAKATKNGIQFLNKKKGPFFLMSEGAKIDHYGHLNNIEEVITESISFDKAITEALKFADVVQPTMKLVD